jgi:cytochrome c
MKWVVAGLGLVSMALMGCSSGTGTARTGGQEDATKPDFYIANVRPIFQSNCYRCHGGMNHKGGLNMQTRVGMLKGGHVGPALVPGDPEKSLMIRLMRHEGPVNDPMPMPPKQSKISDADIATVKRWIKAGAIMP